MKATYKKYTLNFKNPSGTSRGILNQKESWFIVLNGQGKVGVGECGILRGLSYDDVPNYEEQLKWACENIALGEAYLISNLIEYPSIQFGIEQAFLSWSSKNMFELFPSNFLTNESPIGINGLIWMGDEGFMMDQLQQKLEQGFSCIKMKIGAIDFEQELKILALVRKKYSKNQIELRVDANGAFLASEALIKLEELSHYDLHSIEQPIKAGNATEMAKLCSSSPLPIALDEELIGVIHLNEKKFLLETINPQFIILKPSFVGGYRGSNEWIRLAEKLGIGWWITSALESNVGLNAIAQWTYTLNTKIPQGLGTGSLYSNNFESPLRVENGNLYYTKNIQWKKNLLKQLTT